MGFFVFFLWEYTLGDSVVITDMTKKDQTCQQDEDVWDDDVDDDDDIDYWADETEDFTKRYNASNSNRAQVHIVLCITNLQCILYIMYLLAGCYMYILMFVRNILCVFTSVSLSSISLSICPIINHVCSLSLQLLDRFCYNLAHMFIILRQTWRDALQPT